MRPNAALGLWARRDQAAVWIGLAALVALSWLYLAHGQTGLSGMGDGGMADSMAPPARGMTAMATAGAGLDTLPAAVLMWGVMMVAMMLPTAAPAISLFLTLAGRRHPAATPSVMTALYVSGYLVIWIGYGVLAALAQWTCTQAALLTPMAASASIWLSALILLAAGLFQFSPLKTACLSKCRSPLAFFLAEWRDGKAGALVLGLRHGSYCVGCCWALMGILFVVGVMNLAGMALLAAFLLSEKIIPARWRAHEAAGVILIGWALWTGAGLWR